MGGWWWGGEQSGDKASFRREAVGLYVLSGIGELRAKAIIRLSRREPTASTVARPHIIPKSGNDESSKEDGEDAGPGGDFAKREMSIVATATVDAPRSIVSIGGTEKEKKILYRW